MFVFACGCGSDDPLERPSGSPPDETEETPTPPPEPEEDLPPTELEIEIDGETVEVGTRNLYDAEEIIVFLSNSITIDPKPSFKDALTICIVFAKTIGVKDVENRVGLLNGVGIEEGYTKDFLLNPDVERTYSNSFRQTSDKIKKIVDADFNDPLATNSTCSGEPCKGFVCGAIKE